MALSLFPQFFSSSLSFSFSLSHSSSSLSLLPQPKSSQTLLFFFKPPLLPPSMSTSPTFPDPSITASLTVTGPSTPIPELAVTQIVKFDPPIWVKP
jgi:hypothetical protein